MSRKVVSREPGAVQGVSYQATTMESTLLINMRLPLCKKNCEK